MKLEILESRTLKKQRNKMAVLADEMVRAKIVNKLLTEDLNEKKIFGYRMWNGNMYENFRKERRENYWSGYIP